jgi:hypothetical protein
MLLQDVNPTLRRFWMANELDDAQSLLDELRDSLTVVDRQAINEKVALWADQQAIANLLIFPILIPADIRVDTLIRGLSEQNIDYYVLAATVGLGWVARKEVNAQQAATIKGILLKLIQQRHDILAERASAVIYPYLSMEDSMQLLRLFQHPNEIVQENSLAALLRLLPYAQRRSFFESAVRSSHLSMSTFLTIMDKLAEVEKDAKDEADYRLNLLASGLTTPLLAYIPNLKDFHL